MRRPAVPGFRTVPRTVFAVTALAAVVTVVLLPEDREQEAPKQPNDSFHFQRAFPHHDIPDGAYANALAQARMLAAAPRRMAAPVSWEQAGPTNVGGRVTSMAVDPGNSSRIYIGAADGGVLRTEDGGTNWTPLLDDFGGLSIGALAHHPTLPGVVYAGTGEANASGDSYDGIGILKTTDFGGSWEVVGLPDSRRIGRLAIDPSNPAVIHAAVSGGLFSKGPDRGMYRSTDAGATWAQTLFVSDSTSAIDVVVDPTNGNHVYAAFWERMRGPGFRFVAGPTSGIWRSTNGGASWSPLTTGLPSGPTVGRIGLAIAPSSPSTLYAIYADTPGFFAGVYKTTNSGNSWFRVDNGSDLSNLYSSFGWYFGNIRVSPTDANRLYALGVRLYRSTNGGGSWSNVTGSQHVDFHALWIDPGNQSHVVTGNDGGVFESFTGSGSWSKKPDLPITQFYAITVDPQVPDRIYGGTQDNSTPRTPTGGLADWDVLIGGDGFTVVVDPTDSDIIYGEAQFGFLVKSTDFGNDFFQVLDGVNGGDRVNWHMPFVMDPNDRLTLYLGTDRVYRTTDGAGFWNAISPDLTDGPGSGNLTFGTLTTVAVAASPSGSGTVWAGADDGSVAVTTNGGTTWTHVDGALPTRYVTRVAAHPADDSVAYVTLSGYRVDEALPHVFRTANFGATWTDISSNLPDAPVNDLVIDPIDTDRLFVGTDVGVYVTNDLGGSWEILGTGLPLAVVSDLELHNPTRRLVAGTHGRSSFKLDLSPAVDAPEAGAAAEAGVHLGSPHPNPSRGEASIAFALERVVEARLTIHDVTGRRVRTLFDGEAARGRSVARWDGRDDSGRAVAAGVYFARLAADGVTRTVKISRVR